MKKELTLDAMVAAAKESVAVDVKDLDPADPVDDSGFPPHMLMSTPDGMGLVGFDPSFMNDPQRVALRAAMLAVVRQYKPSSVAFVSMAWRSGKSQTEKVMPSEASDRQECAFILVVDGENAEFHAADIVRDDGNHATLKEWHRSPVSDSAEGLISGVLVRALSEVR